MGDSIKSLHLVWAEHSVGNLSFINRQIITMHAMPMFTTMVGLMMATSMICKVQGRTIDEVILQAATRAAQANSEMDSFRFGKRGDDEMNDVTASSSSEDCDMIVDGDMRMTCEEWYELVGRPDDRK